MSDQSEDPKGTLDPAPVTPTEEKSDPEAGTGSADKRSDESLAEQHDSDDPGQAGAQGGDQQR